MKKIKKVVITTGALLLMAMAPISQANPLGVYMNEMSGVITAHAAEQSQLSYSSRWEVQQDGSWKYKLDAGGYATGWIQDEVDKNWYYMDESATMQSGVYKSYGKYYLLSEVHDGHFGHLVKNGETYNGVFISADTSAECEGALTDATLSALRNAGVNVDNVKDISGSQHVSDGAVQSNPSNESITHEGNGGNTPTTNQGASSAEDILNSFAGLADNTGGYGGVNKDVADRIAAGMQGGDYN